MTDVGGEQLRVEDERRAGDEVVSIVDPGIRPPVRACKRSGGTRYGLVDRHPHDRGQELLERAQLVAARAGQKLQAEDLARREDLTTVDQAS